MKKYNLQSVTIFVLLLLVVSLTNFGCKDDSSSSSEDSSDSSGSQSTANNTSTFGPLVGQWIVDLDATLNYHGLFGGYTDAERAAYEAASFEFTGNKFKYNLRDKSGEVDYKVQSVNDQSYFLEISGGITPTLTFILRPDGKLVLPQDPRWDMLVLKKK